MFLLFINFFYSQIGVFDYHIQTIQHIFFHNIFIKYYDLISYILFLIPVGLWIDKLRTYSLITFAIILSIALSILFLATESIYEHSLIIIYTFSLLKYILLVTSLYHASRAYLKGLLISLTIIIFIFLPSLILNFNITFSNLNFLKYFPEENLMFQFTILNIFLVFLMIWCIIYNNRSKVEKIKIKNLSSLRLIFFQFKNKKFGFYILVFLTLQFISLQQTINIFSVYIAILGLLFFGIIDVKIKNYYPWILNLSLVTFALYLILNLLGFTNISPVYYLILNMILLFISKFYVNIFANNKLYGFSQIKGLTIAIILLTSKIMTIIVTNTDFLLIKKFGFFDNQTQLSNLFQQFNFIIVLCIFLLIFILKIAYRKQKN
ncbi:hypothetical protein [Paraphotobacterium marinum]